MVFRCLLKSLLIWGSELSNISIVHRGLGSKYHPSVVQIWVCWIFICLLVKFFPNIQHFSINQRFPFANIKNEIVPSTMTACEWKLKLSQTFDFFCKQNFVKYLFLLILIPFLEVKKLRVRLNCSSRIHLFVPGKKGIAGTAMGHF